MASGSVRVGAGGAGAFSALAADLRKAGAVGLRRELHKALQRQARPVIRAVRESAASRLPRSGGLAGRVAKASITVRGSTARNPSIRIIAKERAGASIDVQALDEGRVRHPLFGNRKHWYAQPVRPGWFTEPLTGHAEAFRAGLGDAIDAIEREISGG